MLEPLPALVRMQRQAQGLTIDALSALAGVSRTRLMALEKGDDNISLELLVKIANALRMTEIRIGGVNVQGATPDCKALVAAAGAIEATEKILGEAFGALEEIKRLKRPVATMLAAVAQDTEPLDEPETEPEPEPEIRMKGRPQKPK